MNAVAQVFAIVGALVHVAAWIGESVFFEHPNVHRKLFLIRTEDVPKVRLWAFNVGFYNLCLAIGAVLGVVLLHTSLVAEGRALVLFTCGCMFVLGIVLWVSDHSRGSGLAAQSVPSAVVLVTALL